MESWNMCSLTSPWHLIILTLQTRIWQTLHYFYIFINVSVMRLLKCFFGLKAALWHLFFPIFLFRYCYIILYISTVSLTAWVSYRNTSDRMMAISVTASCNMIIWLIANLTVEVQSPSVSHASLIILSSWSPFFCYGSSYTSHSKAVYCSVSYTSRAIICWSNAENMMSSQYILRAAVV